MADLQVILRRTLWRIRRSRFPDRMQEAVHHIRWKGAVALLPLIVFGWVLVDSWRSRVIIDRIIVPKALEERGFTADVVTLEALDQVEAVSRYQAGDQSIYPDQRPSIQLSSEAPDFDVELPGTKASLRSAMNSLQLLMGRGPVRISGELTAVSRCGTGAQGQEAGAPQQCLQISVREKDGPALRSSETVCVSNADVPGAITRLAHLISEDTDPLGFAYYLNYHEKDGQTALQVLHRYLLHAPAKYGKTAYDLAGLIEDEQKQTGAANEDFRKAIEIDPAYSDAYHHWGNLMFKLGNRTEGLNLYEKAITADPKNARPYVSEAAVFYSEEKYDEPIHRLEQAVRLNPNSAEAHFGLAETLSRQGQDDDAEKEYRSALDREPNFANAHIALGDLLWRAKASNAAADEYRIAAQLAPSAAAYFRWGLALQASDPLQAAEKFRLAIKLKPDDEPAHLQLGRAYLQLNDKTNSLGEFEKSLQLEPNDPEAHFELGLIHKGDGDWQGAQEEFQKAFNGAGSSPRPELYDELANALTQLGRAKEAKAVLEKKPLVLDAP